MTTGAKSRINFLWEDNGFRQSPSDSDHKVFGADTRISQRSGSHNALRVFNPSSRDAIDIIEQNFEGSITIEFNLANPWFLRGVISEATTTANDLDSDGTDDNYTHSFSGEELDPFRVILGDEAGGDENVIKGIVAGTCTIDVQAAGEFVPVTLECAYAESTLNEDVTLTAQDTLSIDPYHFGEGNVEIGGSRVARVQSSQVTIANNVDLIYELGDRLAVDYSEKQREPDISLTKIREPATDRLKDFYGGDTSVGGSISDNKAKANLKFVRNDGTASEESIDLSLGGSFPNDYDASTIGDPREDIEEDLTRYAKTVSASATNAISSAR